MIIEAATKLQIEPKTAVHHLKTHPNDAKRLQEHLSAPNRIQDMGVRILPTEFDDIAKSGEIKTAYGLLTNDAITIALIRRHELCHVVTNDPDFERVSDLTVWKPEG